MSVKGSQLRIGLFATVAALAWVNALALFGDEAARWVAVVLQSAVGIGALCCAVVVSRQVMGFSRSWRLLVIAATLSWFVGELSWWLGRAGSDTNAAPPAGVFAYFLPPVLSLAAMVLLARYDGGLRAHRDTLFRHAPVVAVLDGLVAALSFSILVFVAGLGAMTGAALPRSQNTAVVIAYSLLELVVVVAAVLMAMAYPRDRPYRANYLLLSGGVVVIAASDRVVAYLRTVDVEGGDLWSGVGAILGPLMIAFAVLQLRPQQAGRRREDVMDWVQSFLPYIGFLGIVMLLAFHVLIGRHTDTLVVCATVLMVVLVTARDGGDASAASADGAAVRGASPTGASSPP
ncbi:hypothetical protein BH09ACT7_BH09ACT7_58940 [soil metagenome]